MNDAETEMANGIFDDIEAAVADIAAGKPVVVVDDEAGTFSVSLIPTTLELTTLGRRAVGEAVNLEVDVLAKYVHRLLTSRTPNLETPWIS